MKKRKWLIVVCASATIVLLTVISSTFLHSHQETLALPFFTHALVKEDTSAEDKLYRRVTYSFNRDPTAKFREVTNELRTAGWTLKDPSAPIGEWTSPQGGWSIYGFLDGRGGPAVFVLEGRVGWFERVLFDVRERFGRKSL